MTRHSPKTRGAMTLGLTCLVATALAGCAEQHLRASPLALPVTSALDPATAPAARPRAIRIGPSDAGAPSPGFVRMAAARVPISNTLPPAMLRGSEPVTMNLTDAPISAIADKVLGDLLGAPYLIDEDIPGIATLSTPRPLPRRRVLALFEQILSARGAALLWSDGVFRIVAADPEAPALRSAALDGGGIAAGIGYATRAIRLTHTQPSAIAEIIRPLAADGAIRSADDESRLLVLAGSQSELAELERLVALFDVDWLRGMSIGLLPLARARARLVAEELLLTVAADRSEGARATRIVPIERARAILVVTPEPEMLRTIQSLMPYLDVSGGDGRGIYLYPVQNRSAAELADLVTRIFAADGSSGGVIGGAVGGPEPIGGELAAPTLQPASFSPAPGQSAASAITAFADEAGNALVIRAPAELYEQAIAVVEQLDTAPSQVLLEVTIAEVTLGDELKYGLEYFLRFGDFEGQLVSTANSVVGPTPPGLSLLLSGGNGTVVLNALSGVTDVNVVSAPSLMVVDNGTATLQVGDQVPIITQSAVDVSDPDAPIVNSVAYRDTGVTMTVSPRVSDNGLVLLRIEQDVSDVVQTTTSGIDSPTIRQRRIATTVAVNDGESLALGGLIRESDSEGVRGVPLLMDIPVAGNLFKTTEREGQRTELLIMITPRVVRNRLEARAVTAELRDRLISLAPAGVL